MTREATPLVSVVIPVYNQAEYVQDAVASVLSQDYASTEVVVVDDGSTDGTGQVLASIEGIKVISQSNRGAAAALNRGLEAASGELICWLSADDEYLPGKLACQVSQFAADPDLAMSYMGYETIDASGNRLASFPGAGLVRSDPFLSIFQANTINGSSVMMKRVVWQELGRFDESLRADVDGDMWLRLTQHHRIAGIDGVWLRYRVHDKSLSADTRLMRECMSAVREPYVASGLLEERVLRSEGPDAGLAFASIALSMSRLGLDTIAAEILMLARKHGAPRRAQLKTWSHVAPRAYLRTHPSARRLVDRLR